MTVPAATVGVKEPSPSLEGQTTSCGPCYVLEEGAGSLGTVCIYEASSPEAIREHAGRADLPVDEIIPIIDTVVVRSDPQPASA